MNRTLLTEWNGKALYEETSTRKQLVEVIRHLQRSTFALNESRVKVEDMSVWASKPSENVIPAYIRPKMKSLNPFQAITRQIRISLP